MDVNLGFYVSVHGLGRNPRDTTLANLHVENGDLSIMGALSNFWRSAENVRLARGLTTWAVSQASPMRRMVIEGNVNLFAVNPGQWDAGYASGGFMSDVIITGTVSSGSQ